MVSVGNIGTFGIGIILLVLGFILKSRLIEWLLDLSGWVLMIVGIILVVVSVIQFFSGNKSSGSNY